MTLKGEEKESLKREEEEKGKRKEMEITGLWGTTQEKCLKITAGISGFVFPITTQRPAFAAAALHTREAGTYFAQGEKAV